jgi:CubicO group peptidase (beta-lactamase class C family)
MAEAPALSSGAFGGLVAPGLESVADAFAANFALRRDAGAAFAVVYDGEPVLDVWGGEAAPGKPWRADTLQLVFSCTKGWVAACMLILIDRGELALDDPVSRHWPEFAANGKQDVSIAEVVSHRARLPVHREPVVLEDVTDDVRMAALLARQAPHPDPRAVAAYHALTYGWLCGELVRRVDGRSVGRFFAEEIAEPLGLEMWIGLPAEHEGRVSTLAYGPGWRTAHVAGDEQLAHDELLRLAWTNPAILPPEGPGAWNTRAFHAAEIPGGNGIATARSIARFYGCLARGGEIDGVRILSPETIALAQRELSRFREPLLSDEPMAYGIGFQLQTEEAKLGPVAEAIGHGGAGGSMHGAWPDRRVGFSYAMNQMRDPANDSRSQALLKALFDAL